MAVVFDTPAVWNPKFGLSAHLMSTIFGYDGSEELRRFASKLGLKKQWLQDAGNPVREHYDLKGQKKVDEAIALGARQITRQELVALMAEKRALYVSKTAIMRGVHRVTAGDFEAMEA